MQTYPVFDKNLALRVSVAAEASVPMSPPSSYPQGWFSENLLPHEPMLRAWLRARFSASLDVDDIIQESYLRILRVAEFKPINAPKAFLFATARNVALNLARAANIRGENIGLPMELLDGEEGIQEALARNQELEILTKAVQALPARCREIFTLCKVYGMSPKQIAQEMALSLPTVYRQLSIGVEKCAQFLEDTEKGRLQ